MAERHANGYWIKEKAFREIRSRLKEARAAEPSQAATLDTLEKDLVRLYYLGKFDDYVARIASRTRGLKLGTRDSGLGIRMEVKASLP